MEAIERDITRTARGESDTVALFNNIDDGDMIDFELLYWYLLVCSPMQPLEPFHDHMHGWAHACMGRKPVHDNRFSRFTIRFRVRSRSGPVSGSSKPG